MVAFDLDRFDLLVLDHEIFVFRIFVTAALVLRLDRLARHLVDELLAKAIAGLLVDLTEGDAIAR